MVLGSSGRNKMADEEVLLSGGVGLDDAEDLVEEIEDIEDEDAAKVAEAESKQSSGLTFKCFSSTIPSVRSIMRKLLLPS
jgi:hypothetical protein